MNINGLFGATPVGGLSPPGETGAPPGTGEPSAADKAKAKAAAAAEANRALLSQIRDKGIYAWAQEQKLEKLREQIRVQVMSERKLDDDALSRLDPAQKASAETSIEAEIAERIKAAMKSAFEGEARMAAQQGKPPAPLIIDISV